MLGLFYEAGGKYENSLVLVSIRILARLHNCLDLWEYFLQKLVNDDRQLSVWT